MPSILGDRFNFEMAWRVALWLLLVSGLVAGLAFGLAQLLQRRRRALEYAEQLRGDAWPSQEAIRKFCEDHLIRASTAAYVQRGTAAGVCARDDTRYWHALIYLVQRADPNTLRELNARGWKAPT